MPNQVHIVIVPSDADGLRRSFAECHRKYTSAINARQGWTGHLWQGRFGSVLMEEAHLLAAVRYVALNPVRAGLVARAEDWPWSSAAAHAAGQDDELVRVVSFSGRSSQRATVWVIQETVSGMRRRSLSGRPRIRPVRTTKGSKYYHFASLRRPLITADSRHEDQLRIMTTRDGEFPKQFVYRPSES